MGYIKDVKIGNETHLIEPILYGTCSTAADVAEKVVNISNFELVNGVRIAVYFTVKNTASNPTLNVNNTGAKAICYNSNRESNTTRVSSATSPILHGWRYFIYNGGTWLLEEDALSLSKYIDDTSYGVKTFKSNTSSNTYIDLATDSSGGIGFHYVSSGIDYSTALQPGGYQGTSSSYTPIVIFNKSTYLRSIATPTVDTDAANKKYVDDKFARALPLSGGTLTGALTLAADPTTNLGAATKQYVDTAVSNVTASIEVVRLI